MATGKRAEMELKRMGTKNMKLVSTSRHKVYSDGLFYLKEARSNENAHEIVLEYTVQKALGKNVKLYPGPPVSLLSPNFGKQVTSLDEDIVYKQAHALIETQNINRGTIDEVSLLAPNMNEIRGQIVERMEDRVDLGTVPASLLSLIPPELETVHVPLTLVHADPRPENWVISPEGELVLIDWESACLAPWEFGLASLVSHTVEYGNPELVKVILEQVERTARIDHSLYEWSMKLRAVSVASWYYYDEGKKSGDKWVSELRLG